MVVLPYQLRKARNSSSWTISSSPPSPTKRQRNWDLIASWTHTSSSRRPRNKFGLSWRIRSKLMICSRKQMLRSSLRISRKWRLNQFSKKNSPSRRNKSHWPKKSSTSRCSKVLLLAMWLSPWRMSKLNLNNRLFRNKLARNRPIRKLLPKSPLNWLRRT